VPESSQASRPRCRRLPEHGGPNSGERAGNNFARSRRRKLTRANSKTPLARGLWAISRKKVTRADVARLGRVRTKARVQLAHRFGGRARYCDDVVAADHTFSVKAVAGAERGAEEQPWSPIPARQPENEKASTGIEKRRL